MTRRERKMWSCAECSKGHAATMSFPLCITPQVLQFCSYECMQALRVRVGLIGSELTVSERTGLQLFPVHHRKGGAWVNVNVTPLKIELSRVESYYEAYGLPDMAVAGRVVHSDWKYTAAAFNENTCRNVFAQTHRLKVQDLLPKHRGPL